MKPLPFDMTPLAEALDKPTQRKNDSTAKRDGAPKPETNGHSNGIARNGTPESRINRAPKAELETPKPTKSPKSSETPKVSEAPKAAPKAHKAPEKPKAEKVKAQAPKPAAKFEPKVDKKAKAQAAKAEKAKIEKAKAEAKKQEAQKAERKPAKVKAKKVAKTASLPAKADVAAIFPKHLGAKSGWLSNLAKEQVHALATHTLARHTEQGLRTLAVTSSVAGEGKTTVTLALAEKLAAAGKRVLIIDLDTHRGTLSNEAQLGTASGAMESAATSATHVYETGVENVSIMPTGRVDFSNGAPVLDPDKLKTLVNRALEAHDIAILDCPPLLPVADTHVIGEIADSAILVVRAGSTPREILEQALEEFGKEKFFAAILNRAKPHNIPYFREVYGYYRR